MLQALTFGRLRSVRRRLGRRGSVLIFVLWLTIGLAAAALVFGHRSMLHYRRGGNALATRQADLAEQGMERYVVALLTAQTTAGTLPDVSTYGYEELPLGEARIWLVGRGDGLDATKGSSRSSSTSSSTSKTSTTSTASVTAGATSAVASAADAPVLGLTDEGGLLNLNTATLEMLEALPGMTPELAAAIIDWRDTDSDTSSNGAESDYYAALDVPYNAKNGPFESVDELRLLHGATPELLYGRDRNRNGIVEDWETALVEANAERYADVPDFGILSLVTVSSREPNLTSTGSARVNLNGPPPQVVGALASVLGAARATQAVNAAGVGSRTFGSVLEFCMRASLSESEATSVLDAMTVTDGEFVPGLVNVNTAPVAVLACLPGIGEDKAESVASWRLQNVDSLTNPLWLVQALGQDGALLAAPYITIHSYQIAADIVAVGDHGRAFRRVRTVFDTLGGTPRVIERRDLTSLGWPLGATLLETSRNPTSERSP